MVHNQHERLVGCTCPGAKHSRSTRSKMKAQLHHHHHLHHLKTNKLLHAQSSLFILILTLIISCTSLTESYNIDARCQPTGSFFCDIKNFLTVRPFNNTLGHTTLDEARSELHPYGFLISLEECRPKVQLFLCSLYFPVCVTPPDLSTNLLLPCKNICEEARLCEPHIKQGMNRSWPASWDCNKFEDYTINKMCVIDNQKEGGPIETSHHTFTPNAPPPQPPPPPPPPPVPSFTPDNVSSCDPGLFDCRLPDPKRQLCIEMKFVCDGKKDCYSFIGSDSYESLDEADCKLQCDEGQLYCDDKCISRHDICNGKVDCSSGVDEQDCIDNLTGVIQSVLCIFVMISAVYILVRLFRVVHEEEGLSHHSETDSDRKIPTTEPQRPIPHHTQLDARSLHEPFYQEPSILTTRSDAYERIIPGGYSGASSLYGFESVLERDKSVATPPAPPPTPSNDRSNSPFMRSNFYENMGD